MWNWLLLPIRDRQSSAAGALVNIPADCENNEMLY
jgi:hypothetical protein